jgi:O-antigen ligase
VGFLSLPNIRPRPGDRPDWVTPVLVWTLTIVSGVVLGLQYWNPNPRIIPVVVALLVFGIAWRLDMVAAMNLLVFLLPYPKGTVFGSTNMAFVLLVFIIWLLRVSLRMSPAPRWGPVSLPIGLMMLWYVLSFYNVTTEHALQVALLNFGVVAACVMLYFLIVNSIRTQQDLKRLHMAQMITALIVFVVAALEARLAGKVIIPGLLDFTATLGHDFNTRDVRVGASFRDYELLSEYCGITFLLAMFLWTRARTQTERWLLALFGLFNLYTMFTTVTRGVVVAMVLVLPYLFYTIRRHLNPVRLMTALLGIAVLVIAMNFLVAKYTNTGDLFLRMSETRVVYGVVPEARAEIWWNAFRRALVHPILGQGPYYAPIWGYSSVWPHNTYLYIANLIGFPGLLYFLALLFGMVKFLKPVVDNLRHASYADAYLIVARTQLFLFMLNELKIDFLRNPIYQYQVWMWFGTWTAAYLVSRDDGVRAGKHLTGPETPPAHQMAA